jgi:translation initiation factor 1
VDWNPWLWAWVGSEDVASAHRLLMEGPETLQTNAKEFCMPRNNDALVYSTEHGDLRKAPPFVPQQVSLPPTQQTAVIQRTSKGRGGKVVTLIKNLHLSPDDHKALTKHLKQTCGSGGTSKDGGIEIQGDHRETVAAALQQLGYKTKMAGG